MPSSLTGEDRAKVIANNRSLRIIKNELEALSERDFITDEQYDTIMSALPAEASLHNTVLPIPGRSSTSTTATSPAPPTDSFASLSVHDRNPSNAAAPPPKTSPQSYNQQAGPTTAAAVAAPLPPRNAQQPLPPPQQHHHQPEIAHVVALYRYSDPDPRDLDLEAGDHVSVTEYCNPEWWQGRNVRSGEDGIFPKNYVRVENGPSALVLQQQQQQFNSSGGERAPAGHKYGGGYPSPQQQHQQQQPPPPMGGYFQNPPQYQPPGQGPSSPYDAPIPPMAVAQQPAGHVPSKGAEMGKKFGKKLGNAAIFGAGMTIGADVVNSIL